MVHGAPPEPPVRVLRKAIPGGAMLYDAALDAGAGALFDRGGWAAHGIVSQPAAAGRGEVTFLTHGARRLVLRRYRRGGLPARWVRESYCFLGEERTRPFREFRLLAEMWARGLPVPRPVAARYQRHAMAYRGELVTRRLDGATALARRWLDGKMTAADWATAGRCIRQFRDAGVLHPDLNADNIMLDGQGHAWLLDFDRGRIGAPGIARDRMLARLARSLARIGAAAGRGDDWREGFALLRSAYDAGTAD